MLPLYCRCDGLAGMLEDSMCHMVAPKGAGTVLKTK
jgi:hypothetical protein